MRAVAVGALLIAVAAPRALHAQEPPAISAQLRGLAYDSVARRPLDGATVRLVPAADPSVARVVTSGADGTFGVEALPTGVWLATMLHPALDSLALEPPVIRLDVREPGVLDLVLAIPSARTLAAQRCGPLPDDAGLLYGVVRSAADGAPLAAVGVTAQWPEWVIERKRRGLRSDMQRRQVVSDSLGRYALCGVPTGSLVRVALSLEADSSGSIGAEVPDHGLLRRDLSIGAASWVTELVADSVTGVVDTVRVRRGRALARGVVRDVNGRAIPNAIVRVLGSGIAGRTPASGEFVVRDAAAGTQTIEARAIGFQPIRQSVELRDDVTLAVDFTLSPQLVQLDTVRVIAGRAVDAAVTEIERRWRASGGGTIMDGETVRARSTIFVTDALRAMNGVRIVPVGGMGQRILMRGFGRECSPRIYLDGVPLGHFGGTMFLDDLVIASDVAAMEVYPRGAMVPAQFAGLEECGAVVVWTYQRLGGVMPRDPRARAGGR